MSPLLKSIANLHSKMEERENMREFRLNALKFCLEKPIIKQAFDTRRINQQNEYNPRRNLQYYHRSDPFITKDASENIKTLFKLKMIVEAIKEDFFNDPDWLDSYCRVLDAALDKTLRIKQGDMDFFQPQLDYINELLYLRYRLKNEDIIKLNEKEIRDILLNKDERLLHKQIYAQYNNRVKEKTSQGAIQKDDNSSLIEVLFGGVKASQDNKEVERSISITIKDRMADAINKNG